jgi:hypothetical protein
VPHAELSTTVSKAVERALAEHRAELVELVEAQVEAELERLSGELVAEAIARRNGSEKPLAEPTDFPGPASDAGEPTKRCSRCRRLQPLSAFNRDRSVKRDGLRASCRSCDRAATRAYVQRQRRARRESAPPAARGGPRDDDEPRPAPAHLGNGRTPQNAPHAGERVPSVDEWLVESGFATLEDGELVATELGLEVGAALADSLDAL